PSWLSQSHICYFLAFPATQGPPPSLTASFPTRRSSDLDQAVPVQRHRAQQPRPGRQPEGLPGQRDAVRPRRRRRGRTASRCPGRDRKSTRLNSSHSQISYAVFCLKKKNFERKISPCVIYRPSGAEELSKPCNFSRPHHDIPIYSLRTI